jgi:hypothetical protein
MTPYNNCEITADLLFLSLDNLGPFMGTHDSLWSCHVYNTTGF